MSQSTIVSASAVALSFYQSLKTCCICPSRNESKTSCEFCGCHIIKDISKTKNSDIIEEYILAQEEKNTTEFMEEWEITLLRLIEEDDAEDADYIRACENGGY